MAHCFVLDLRRKAVSLSPWVCYLLWDCHTWPLLCWGSSLYHQFIENFYHECSWTLWNDFFISIKMVIWFSSFTLLILCITLIWWCWNLRLWNKFYLIMVYDTFNAFISYFNCWIQFTNILLWIFASMFNRNSSLCLVLVSR